MSDLDELRADLVVCLINGHTLSHNRAERRVAEIEVAVRAEHGERIAEVIENEVAAWRVDSASAAYRHSARIARETR